MAFIGLYLYRYATKAVPLIAKGYGVHVCTSAHYDAARSTCLSDDRSVAASALNTDYLTAAALADSETVGLTLTVQVSQRAGGGTDSLLGRAKLNVMPGSYRAVTTVSDVFASAGVVPASGATYRFEVDQSTATQIGGPLGTVIVSLTS